MDKELIEEKEGFKLFLVHDLDPESPREWDNLGTMVCFHRNYWLGDKNPRGESKHNFKNNQEFLEWWEENGNDGVILPLYLYDHSGLTMSVNEFNDRWDSGQVGWIYATKETIIKEYGEFDKEKDEVAVYNQYLQGDVWGYIVENEDGEHLDSCWGFYGYEYAKEEGKRQLEWEVKNFHDQEEMAKNYMAL